MFSKLVSTACALLLASCGSVLSGYATGGSKNPAPPSLASQHAVGKVSPGSANVTGQNLRGQITVTPKNVTISGPHLAAKITFSQNR